MEVDVFSQVISNLGFPIACVVAMFWMWNSERESHMSEMKEITQAIQNNTLAITKLTERIGHSDD